MATPSPQSVIIIGGGIAGLTCATVLQARGHRVTLIYREPMKVTASGVAAGMIAPALEAMNDPVPADSFRRLTEAQRLWWTLDEYWPERMRRALPVFAGQPSFFLWRAQHADAFARLQATGADLIEADAAMRHQSGLPEDMEAVRVSGDWSLPGTWWMAALADHFAALGGHMTCDEVTGIEARRVRVRDGGWLAGDAIVVAAGIGARGLGSMVPSLGALTPIKGHVLDLPAQGRTGVWRTATGYLAAFQGYAKFGASMEAGRDDTHIDPSVVADLKGRAAELFPGLDLLGAEARAGVRASTPDGWPLIGRDAASGVLVAAGMRRNGYVFAPLAAKILLDMIEGREAGDLYRPDRFDGRY